VIYAKEMEVRIVNDYFGGTILEQYINGEWIYVGTISIGGYDEGRN
jgi:hypothetical protein